MCTIALIPVGSPPALGIDEQRDPADMFRHQKRPLTCRHKQLPAKSAALNARIHRQAAEAEDRNVIAAEPAAHDLRRPRITDARRAQRVEAEHAFGLLAIHRDETLGAAALVIL